VPKTQSSRRSENIEYHAGGYCRKGIWELDSARKGMIRHRKGRQAMHKAKAMGRPIRPRDAVLASPQKQPTPCPVRAVPSALASGSGSHHDPDYRGSVQAGVFVHNPYSVQMLARGVQ
jgi:hypothetical protein